VETDRAAGARAFHAIIKQCPLAEKSSFNGLRAVGHTAERLEIGRGVV